MSERPIRGAWRLPPLGKFGRKLTIMFLCIALVPLFGYGVMSLRDLRQFSIRSAERELEDIIKMLTLLCEAQEALDRIKHESPGQVDAQTGATRAWQEGDRFLTLRELIRSIKVGETGYCYILDSKGVFQIHPTLEKKNLFRLDTGVEQLKQIREQAVSMRPGEVKTIRYPWPDESGKIKTKVAKFGYFRPYDWIVVVATFETEILKPYYADRMALLVFLSVTVLLVTLLALFFSRYLIRPIVQLTKATTALAQGDFSVKIPEAGDDEIGTMAQSFRVMVQRLSEAHADLVHWSRTLEQKVMERTAALEKAHDRMVLSEKMASLGKLSAMVAHEINNPLSGVLSYLKLTMKLLGRIDPAPADAPKINQYLDLSAGEVKRCGEIVKNLLMFSKQTFGEFKYDNLNLVVEKSVALIKHSAEMKNIAIAREVDTDHSDQFWCDSSGIQQMFVALMVNALDAMEDKGGGLTIRTDYSDETQVKLEVIDTGKGIPADVLPRIFEPFFSFKESKKSIGMGLSVVYGIVQSHGGTVNVESTVGVGTTFTIVLPRRAPGAEPPRAAFPAAAPIDEGDQV